MILSDKSLNFIQKNPIPTIFQRNLYITSFRANPGDTDSIRIYYANGTYWEKIDLDVASENPKDRAYDILPISAIYAPLS